MRAKRGIYVEDINTVYITGAGYIREAFTGLGRNSIGYNEVVWAANLTRSNTFSLENIDDVDFGYVPQCQLHFPYMNMDDFIKLQRMLRERHLIVDYFDVDLGKRVVHEMAITKNERKKIYSSMNYINGVYDFTVTLVGTNRDEDVLKKCTIQYDANGGEGQIASQESGSGILEHYTFTDQVKISSGKGFKKQGYHLESWNTEPDGSGDRYVPNSSITINSDLYLYAIWEA